MEKEIKELRVKIDGLAQLCEGLHKPSDPMKNANWVIYTTKEVEKVVDSLYLAKAWLGKVLEELGASNPYKSGYKTVEDIVPTADIANIYTGLNSNAQMLLQNGEIKLSEIVEGELWNSKNHIEKCDWLRKEIKQVIKNLPETKPSSRLEAIAWTNTYNYLSEARMFLGFELARIKEENDKGESNTR